MQNELSTRIEKGMDVEDADGDAIGSVSAVYQPVAVQPPGALTAAPVTDDARIKVGAGLLGLGGHWYIPLSAVRTVVDNRVILTVDKTKLGDLGWGEKPAWIRD